MTPTKWLWVVGISLVIALIAVAMTTNRDDPGITHVTGRRLSAGRPECPTSWDTIPFFGVDASAKVQGPAPEKPAGGRPRGGGSADGVLSQAPVFTDSLRLPGPKTNIPEFNDCQKFILREGAIYDSLYAIFAAFKVDSIVDELDWENVTWSSANAAIVTVTPTGVATALSVGITTITATSTVDPARKAALLVTVLLPPVPPPATVSISGGGGFMITMNPGQSATVVPALAQPTPRTMPVAEIYTYGPGYPPLGIGQNFSCLYLYFDSTFALTAKMVHTPTLGTEPNACAAETNPAGAVGKILAVKRHPSGREADYPGVARWDWDPEHGVQTIGVKCGNAWCEIGPRMTGGGFASSRRYGIDGATSTSEGRMVGIKGWYDEQYLAIAKPGSVRPSTILGTVIPAPDVSESKNAFNSTWITVAFVAIDTTGARAEDVQYYKRKLNLDPVIVQWPLTKLNQLLMCYGTRSACGVPSTTPPADKCGPEHNAFFVPTRRLWARIVSARGDIIYRCVTERNHKQELDKWGLTMAPTARWRWLLNDETVWRECALGCCQIETEM